MTTIKTSLKQLREWFWTVAAERNDPFSAKLTVLTAHVERVEGKLNKLGALSHTQIDELANFVIELREKAGISKPAAAPTQPAAPAQEKPNEAVIEEEDDETLAKALLEKTQQEEDAEIAAINAAPMAPMLSRKNNGTVEGAA